MKKWILIFMVFVTVFWLANGENGWETAVAQTTSSTAILSDNFSNGSNPPRMNTFNFNHSFTLGTAWDLGGSTINEPLSPSPPFALTLYAGNQDRITFNLPSPTAYVGSAQIWGWAPPTRNDLAAGRGRVVFEGTGDSKTFNLIGGAQQWQLFKATANDLGDAGLPLGAIVAVRLADLGDNGVQVMYDNLEVRSVTPPRRANLALTMSGSASNVNVGDILTYDLTVTNSGPDAAPNVALTDVLPVGATFLPGSSDAACGLSLGQVVCNLGSLAVNGSRTVRIAVQVGSDACATLFNRATVTAQALDGNMANNTAVHTATTPLPACADYSVTLTGNQVPVNPEEFFTYELTIRNNGPDTTSGTLNVTWPAEMLVYSVVPDSGVSCGGFDPLSCTIAPLVAGQQKQIIVTGKTTLGATGLMEAMAQVTPNVPDPQQLNNSSRYRYVIGTPYSYAIIAEAGVGALAGFDNVRAPVINNNGEVAFWATLDGSGSFADFAVYSGDGNSLTRRFGRSDLPVVADPFYHNFGLCLSMNDGGWITAVPSTWEAIPDSFHPRVASFVYLLPPSGSPVVLASTSEAADGWDYRQYGTAVLNNSNRVLATHSSESSFVPSGITQFIAGQPTDVYTTTNDVIGLGLNDNNEFAYLERSGTFFPSYELFWQRPDGTPPRNILQYPSPPWSRVILNMNNLGQLPYSQKHQDPSTGLFYESFFTFGSQPIIQRMALDNSVNEGGWAFLEADINDYGRWVVRAQGWGPNNRQHGLFIGPHYVAHRVVNFQGIVGADPGTPMFGSRAHTGASFCTASMNDAGQVVFDVTLANGRKLIVRADPTQDNDGDGVTDYDELAAPNFGDGNGDGVPDSVQPHVTAVPSLVDPFQTIPFTTDQNHTLSNVQAIPNPSPGNAPSDSFPLGFYALEITDVPVGGATTLQVTLPWPAVRRWWKYGRTPNNTTPHWYEFSFDGTTGAQINGNVVTLHFVDGQRGDDDLTANGTIVDPGGPSGFANTVYLPATMQE
ncbi:MAG: DUF11 domain-containing protein [Ardenticatenaceae bacterium]|nr:DUF11 domain-containing protein [Anaerolineales bacterium]MCB8942020.1 DUF11 domain-containing protein [Ardenticatenaceae bacterium]MCB8973220.1 DUF11 domain-containing protein [Ardenticatenaceae bacterium]